MDAMQTPEAQATHCFRHPQRESYVRCTRCDRYICPDCMRDAPVGHQCVECVREGHKSIRQARTVFGANVVTVPVVTYVLIAVNVLVYLLELAMPAIVDRFDGLGQGVSGPDGCCYRIHGSVLPPDFHAVGIAHGEWYRLITSAFLHQPPGGGAFGITHILFNMYSLWVLGQLVEVQLGRVRFLSLYLVSALGGSVLVYLIAPQQAALGASGAIFGLAGTWFMLTRRLRHARTGANRMLTSSLIWLVASAGITSWQGHLGGLLAGVVVGAFFAFAPRKGRALWQAGGVVAVLAVLISLAVFQTSQLLATPLWA